MDHSQKYMERVFDLARREREAAVVAAEAKGYKAGLLKAAEMTVERAGMARDEAVRKRRPDDILALRSESGGLMAHAARLRALAERE